MSWIKILYVEDEKNVREMMSRFIERFCDELFVAQDGQEGLELFKQHRCDIVISDIRMPKMSGIDMVKAIKEINKEQQVIFTTAHIENDYLFEAIQLQVSAYVPKPIDLDILKERIDTAKAMIEYEHSMQRLKESEEKFRLLAQTAQMGIFIYRDHFIYVNEAFCTMLGYSAQELYDMPAYKLLEPHSQQVAKEDIKSHLEEEESSHFYPEIVLHTKEGHKKICRISTQSIEINGQKAGMGTAVDITDILETEEYLNLLKHAVEQMQDMLKISDKEGRLVYVNKALLSHTGYSKEELIGQKNSIFKSGKHDQKFYEKLWNTVLSKQTYKGVFINKTKSGALYHEEQTITPILDHHGEIRHFVSTSREVSQRIKKEKELNRLAHIDTLTNIYNRRAMEEYLDKEIYTAQYSGTVFGVLMIDVDFFKQVNDTYGHDVGDEVLKRLSELVSQSIRGDDYFGRIGGEEFLLILPNCQTEESLVGIAEKIRQKVAQADMGKAGHITISLGATLYANSDDRPGILKRVDEALYRSKEEGRNRTTFL